MNAARHEQHNAHHGGGPGVQTARRKPGARCRALLLIWLPAVLVGAWSGRLAPPAARADESRSAWQYIQTVPLPPAVAGATKWWDFVLTPSVFDGARLDLADLRLHDGQGRERQYALRVRRPEHATAEVKTREFNRSRGPDNSSQLSLDLGEERFEHNEVEVQTAGTNYRRAVVLEGSDDEERWSRLAAQNLLHFQRGKEEFRERTVSYSPSRFRYLRITLQPDPVVDRDPVEIGAVTVRRRVDVPGEFVTRPAPLGPREAARGDGGWGSSWIIDLGGKSIPCDRLYVQIQEPEFVRDYRIEAGGPPDSDQPFGRVGGGVWRRRAGEAQHDLLAEFPEVTAARLRLVVTDFSNPPLHIEGVRVAAPARAVIVAYRADLPGPLQLYFGNPKAEAPNYDFARNLEPRLEPPPQRLQLGERQPNPAYQPEPLPLTERLPWLIYVLLGIAIAVLGVLILSLARAAIALEDTRQEAVAG
jgi:hypothetical protein